MAYTQVTLSREDLRKFEQNGQIYINANGVCPAVQLVLEPPSGNHFDDFCKFIRSQKWMSELFGTQLIQMFMAGQSDAYERGKESVTPAPKSRKK